MNKIQEEILKILNDNKEIMLKNLKWYENLPGKYNGKIKLNREYAIKIKDEIINCEDPYPTKLVYIYGVNPIEYNTKYPKAVNYENYKIKAYQILYLEYNNDLGWYSEDLGFSIGLELIFKEFIDKYPQWNQLITF